jgi:hypothetical protein
VDSADSAVRNSTDFLGRWIEYRHAIGGNAIPVHNCAYVYVPISTFGQLFLVGIGICSIFFAETERMIIG